MSQSDTIRGRILDAAFTAFMQRGYEGASTADIARLARVSKRDLYANFTGKQAMLEACIVERAEAMRRPLNLPPPPNKAVLREMLVQYGMAVVRELSRPEVLATFRLAIVNADNAPAVAQTLDSCGRASATAGLVDLLRVAGDRGLMAGADPEEMAEVYLGILMQAGMLVRMLTRVIEPPDEAETRKRAVLAAGLLERLYGT